MKENGWNFKKKPIIALRQECISAIELWFLRPTNDPENQDSDNERNYGMKDIGAEQVRNFVLMGHSGSGKTTLADAILYKTGVNDRHGSVDDGTSMCDHTDDEKERKTTIWAKPFQAKYKNSAGNEYSLVMMDVPGYVDFQGQQIMAARVADAALITVDSTGGIEVGTTRSWRHCEKLELPRAVVLTGVNKDNADFYSALEKVREVWGARCVPVTAIARDHSRVIDVLAAAGGDQPEEIEAFKNELIEIAAESDDTLLEKYLGGEELSRNEILEGLRGSMNSGGLIPVFAVSSPADVGVDELMETIALLFPSPLDRPVRDADGNDIDPAASAPFSGLVWRSSHDPFVGSINYVRVYSGTLKADSEVMNKTKGQKERIGSLLLTNGKKQIKVDEVSAGDIVALAKMKITEMNDSLGESLYEPIVFPNPVVSYAVYPRSTGDEDKLANALSRVAQEDPTIHTERNKETSELILSGMGDMQVKVVVDYMKNHGNVEVDLQTPKVAYKETINGRAEGHYRHKKQSGGRGQYGEVFLRVEPRQPDDEEWFCDEIVGGAIPGGFMTAVQKGLVEGMQKGCLANNPVTQVKVRVYDGSYHDVDSSEVAFKIAAARAFRDAMQKANPVLLEPIMKIRIFVPDQFMGDITGDLNHRRGRILGMGSEDGMQLLEAEVPQAEIFQYSSQLRSMTGGRGTFELEFLRYDVVPANVAQKVIAAARKADEEEE